MAAGWCGGMRSMVQWDAQYGAVGCAVVPPPPWRGRELWAAGRASAGLRRRARHSRRAHHRPPLICPRLPASCPATHASPAGRDFCGGGLRQGDGPRGRVHRHLRPRCAAAWPLGGPLCGGLGGWRSSAWGVSRRCSADFALRRRLLIPGSAGGAGLAAPPRRAVPAARSARPRVHPAPRARNRQPLNAALCSTPCAGATNLVTGLADALLDSVPLVAITGQARGAGVAWRGPAAQLGCQPGGWPACAAARLRAAPRPGAATGCRLGGTLA